MYMYLGVACWNTAVNAPIPADALAYSSSDVVMATELVVAVREATW